MRSLLAAISLFLILAGATVVGWFAMNYYHPGTVGTPAHAGAVSNGRLDQCTNANFFVRPRSKEARTVALEEGDLLRGTFEADGGFGRVDVIMRIVSPFGEEIAATQRVSNYDFTLPVKIRGEYSFVFDNRYSMYTSKSIGLFYCIDSGQPVQPITPFFEPM